jgi:hypothetical protein
MKRTDLAALKKKMQTEGPAFQKTLLSSLSAADRKKLRLALSPRNQVFSLRFNKSDIDAWRRAAKLEKRSITDCVEEVLNTWAARRGAR